MGRRSMRVSIALCVLALVAVGVSANGAPVVKKGSIDGIEITATEPSHRGEDVATLDDGGSHDIGEANSERAESGTAETSRNKEASVVAQPKEAKSQNAADLEKEFELKETALGVAGNDDFDTEAVEQETVVQ